MLGVDFLGLTHSLFFIQGPTERDVSVALVSDLARFCKDLIGSRLVRASGFKASVSFEQMSVSAKMISSYFILHPNHSETNNPIKMADWLHHTY
jgi:hypothetical protein